MTHRPCTHTIVAASPAGAQKSPLAAAALLSAQRRGCNFNINATPADAIVGTVPNWLPRTNPAITPYGSFHSILLLMSFGYLNLLYRLAPAYDG
jgi:hypothetical protein